MNDKEDIMDETMNRLFSFFSLFIYLLLGSLCFPLPLRADFDFDELELIQSSEQAELLEQARKAADGNEFSKADSLIQQARQKGYAPDEVKEAENFLASRKSAYAAEQARIAREEEKRLAEERRRKQEEAARQARLAQQRYDASGNKGGKLRCTSVAQDFGLWRYCTEGTCDGLSEDYNLWRLCEYDDVGAMSGNYNVWRYLKDGVDTFTDDMGAYQGAKQNSGSFADRKRFVIYYLRGYVFYSY